MVGIIILIGIMLLICPPFGLVCLLSAIIVGIVCSVQRKRKKQTQTLPSEYHSPVYDDITALVERNRQEAEMERMRVEMERTEKERQKNADKEAKLQFMFESAQYDINYLAPIKRDLEKRIKDVTSERKYAAQVGKCGENLAPFDKELDKLTAKLYNVSKKLEKAEYNRGYAEAHLADMEGLTGDV